MIVGMVDDRALRFRQQAMPPASGQPRSVSSFSQPAVNRRQPRPTPRPVAPTPSPVNPLGSMGERYLSSQQNRIKSEADFGKGVLNFLNPAPSLTSAVAEGRAPRPADVALDAGLFAAGFIPIAGPGIRAGGLAARGGMQAAAAGSRAARPALETGQAIAARRNALDRLLNIQGPRAVEEFLRNSERAYEVNADLYRKFFGETSERIPQGLQMYRAPSAGQVTGRGPEVPLPREPGAEWIPNQIQAAGGSGDLQRLGGLFFGKTAPTGGRQELAPGLVKINVAEDLPGISNINEFLARFNNPRFARSDFSAESVLGPRTRYVVDDFNPAGATIRDLTFPTWNLRAYPE
jgi:hypothetical protein